MIQSIEQRPQEVGTPEQGGKSATLESCDPTLAKTESFFCSLTEWQWGQGVSLQSMDRTSISLSFLQS